MEGCFFKKRRVLDFKPHKYDLGIPFWQTRSHLDMHFLRKIRKIGIEEYPKLYDYHLTYYLETSQNSEEKKYLEQLYDLVGKYKKKEFHRDSIKMSPKEKTNSERIIKDYDDFLQMMKSMDRWGITSSEKEGIKIIQRNIYNNQESIAALKKEINRLEKELDYLRNENQTLRKKYHAIAVSPPKKIIIKDEHFATLVNLISELKEVKLPESLESIDNSSKNFFTTPKKSDSTWNKLISNHFSLEGKEIKSTRVENYFKKDTSNRVPPLKANQCKVEILPNKVQ